MPESMPLKPTVHFPVMADEVIELLKANEKGVYLDCTLGGGGHTERILLAHPENEVFAVDRDFRAIERAKIRLQRFNERVTFIHASFSELGSVVNREGFQGMVADLGFSTDQLREGRGFSFVDQSLDMRMNASDPVTAEDILNNYTEQEIYKILKVGGVGQEARAICKAILQNRPVKTAEQLADLIQKSAPAQKGKSHPATVVFQALRIEVNQEQKQLQDLLHIIPKVVDRDNGRVAIISFHSLEDKEVGKTMREWSRGDDRPAYLRNSEGKKKLGNLLTKKAIEPSEDEIKVNPASRSALLRVFEFNN